MMLMYKAAYCATLYLRANHTVKHILVEHEDKHTYPCNCMNNVVRVF